jgi:hypothetical protein
MNLSDSINCDDLKGLELSVMHSICDQGARKRGEGSDGSFNLEQFLNKEFGGTRPHTSHQSQNN